MSVKEEAVAIKASDLKDIIATAVAAAINETRKPTEKEVRALEAAQEERKANSADVKAQIQLKKDFQTVCSHTQDFGRAGDKTAMVFVNQDFPNAPGGGKYLICQQCQAKVVPGPAPKDAHPDFTYDSALFNKHFQMIRFE